MQRNNYSKKQHVKQTANYMYATVCNNLQTGACWKRRRMKGSPTDVQRASISKQQFLRRKCRCNCVFCTSLGELHYFSWPQGI